MKTSRKNTFWIMVVLVVWARPARGQDFANYSEDFWKNNPAPEFKLWKFPDGGPPASSTRLRMFGMPTGYTANPLGLLDEEEFDPRFYGMPKEDDSGPFQLYMGYDIPTIDPWRPGSPGGLGYYRICSQLGLVDTKTTSMCLGLQAFAPAGAQFGGLNTGPTVVSPSLAWFHDLGKGAALQGFVSENFRSASEYHPMQGLNSRTFYGLGLQCPLPFQKPKEQNLFFFVEALGTVRYQQVEGIGPRPSMQILPGFQFHLNDNCWLSLGATPQHGIFSCSWQF